MKLIYPACFYPCENSDGYTVIIPDLKGCVTEGKSLVEAIEMAIDVASGWILSTLEDGETVPKPSSYKDIILEYEDGFVNLIVLDINSYAEKHGDNAVRKNLTIPAWLNTMAEKNNINFSRLLQDSLIKELEPIK